MTTMKAEHWIAFCKAQSTVKCKKCGKVTDGWKELEEHQKNNPKHTNYECVGFLNMGVSFNDK